MDELERLREQVEKLQKNEIAMVKAIKQLQRQPERQYAQVSAMLPALTRLFLAIGARPTVVRNWQELVMDGTDRDRLQRANLEMFDEIERCTPARGED